MHYFTVQHEGIRHCFFHPMHLLQHNNKLASLNLVTVNRVLPHHDGCSKSTIFQDGRRWWDKIGHGMGYGVERGI